MTFKIEEGGLQDKILVLLEIEGGLTIHQMVDMLSANEQSIRGRIYALREHGYVEITGTVGTGRKQCNLYRRTRKPPPPYRVKQIEEDQIDKKYQLKAEFNPFCFVLPLTK